MWSQDTLRKFKQETRGECRTEYVPNQAARKIATGRYFGNTTYPCRKCQQLWENEGGNGGRRVHQCSTERFRVIEAIRVEDRPSQGSRKSRMKPLSTLKAGPGIGTVSLLLYYIGQSVRGQENRFHFFMGRVSKNSWPFLFFHMCYNKILPLSPFLPTSCLPAPNLSLLHSLHLP